VDGKIPKGCTIESVVSVINAGHKNELVSMAVLDPHEEKRKKKEENLRKRKKRAQ
jgi:hypothetical protein